MTLAQEIAAIVLVFALIGGLRFCTPVKEEARAEAGEGAVAAAVARGFDPSRPPRAMRDDCASQGKEFMAWRADGALAWSYDCLEVRRGG